jgi:hypothetical protein
MKTLLSSFNHWATTMAFKNIFKKKDSSIVLLLRLRNIQSDPIFQNNYCFDKYCQLSVGIVGVQYLHSDSTHKI